MKLFMVSLVISMIVQMNTGYHRKVPNDIVNFYVNKTVLMDDMITNQDVTITIDEKSFHSDIIVYHVTKTDEIKQLTLDWEYENSIYKATYHPDTDETFQLRVELDKYQSAIMSTYITYDTYQPMIDMYVNDEKVSELPKYLKENSKVQLKIVDVNLDVSTIRMCIKKDDRIVHEDNQEILEYVFLEEGRYDVVVYAKDFAQNEVVYEHSVYVDAFLPKVEIKGNQERLDEHLTYFDEDVEIQICVEDDMFYKEASKVIINDKIQTIQWKQIDGIWIANFVLEEEKEYQIVYECKDQVEHVVQGNVQLIIDKSAPKVDMMINGENVSDIKDRYHQTLDINFMIEEANMNLEKSYILLNEEQIQISKIGNHYEAKTTIKDGIYRIQYYIVDDVGHVTQYESSTFMIDTNAPIVSVTTNTSSAVVNERIDVLIEIQEQYFDENSSKFWVEHNGKKTNLKVNKTAKGNYQLSFQSEEEGDYRIHIEAYDQVGNQSVYYLNGQKVTNWKDLFFQIDKTRGTIQIQLENSTISTSQKVWITLLDEDIVWKNVNVFIYKGGNMMDSKLHIEHNEAYVLLDKEGSYRIDVQGYDEAGNQAVVVYDHYVVEDGVTFAVDQKAPTITYQVAYQGICKDKQDVWVQFEDEHLKEYEVEVFRNQQLYLREKGSKQQNWTHHFFEGEGLQGVYELIISAIDYAGNIQKEYVTFTIDHMPYRMKAFLNGVPIKDGSTQYLNQNANVRFQFEDAHAKQVVLEISKNGKTEVITLTENSYEWNADIQEGQEDTYMFKVRSIDQANNINEKTFKIVLDRKLPVLQWVNTIANGSILSHSWIPILKGEYKEFYVISWSLWKNQKLVNYEWHDAITEEGYYTLQVVVQDYAFNMNTLVQPLQFEIDHTPPLVQIRQVDSVHGITSSSILKKELVIEIVQNDPLKKQEEYFTKVVVNEKDMLTSPKQSKIMLTPNLGQLNVYVEAIDQAGNITTKQWEFQVEQTHVSSVDKQQTSSKNLLGYFIGGCLFVVLTWIYLIYRVKKYAV